MIGAPSGFEAAFQEFVYYAGPALQLAYWLTMIVVSVCALVLFKRWVEFQTAESKGAAKAKDLSESISDPEQPATSSSSATGATISVDEFVD